MRSFILRKNNKLTIPMLQCIIVMENASNTRYDFAIKKGPYTVSINSIGNHKPPIRSFIALQLDQCDVIKINTVIRDQTKVSFYIKNQQMSVRFFYTIPEKTKYYGGTLLKPLSILKT